MDGIHDLGGTEGWGACRPAARDEPPFSEEWERRAFALGLLSMRVSGSNLDAMRHAMNRIPPGEYVSIGSYGRYLGACENLLIDSGIIAPDAVDARVASRRGDDVNEPADPEPSKPGYRPTAPGSLREVETPPRFSPGDRVRARDLQPSGHTRLPRYVRGRTGTVRRVQPAAVLPDTHAHFAGENAQHVYSVAFAARELWGAGSEDFVLHIDLYESYLEPPHE